MKRNHSWTVGSIAVVSALMLAGCAGDDTTSSQPTSDGAAGELETLSIVSLPGVDSVASIKLGVEKGYFEEVGIALDFTEVDAPPSAISAVASGQYDIGWASPSVIVTAMAGGVDLRSVAGGARSREAGNVGTITMSDSGITGWADLAGHSVATPAPRSVLTLAMLQQIRKAGADPSTTEMVTLPVAQSVTSIEDGSVDASGVLKPYLAEALSTNPDIIDLGDAVAETFGIGALLDTFYTSAQTATDKQDLLDRFRTATQRSYDDTNALPDDQWREVIGTALGKAEAEWPYISLQTFEVPVAASELDNYVDALIEEGWIEQGVDTGVYVETHQ
ncbi:ABC transporter substrate-binding protein [Microbacterium sp.]|uniref:ABC transporter substrate-binding protein n=1 Tax=Microbacterium sp. TaxID=51671 RepID=UPI003A88E524